MLVVLCLHVLMHVFICPEVYLHRRKSNQGRMVDALAHGGDEGRDKLR